jgi:predicted small lipoprotein YifL
MFFLALIAALAAPLGGCGRKATLELPPGSDHPRRFPTQ